MSQQEQVEVINRLRARHHKQPIDLIILTPDDWKAKMMHWRKDDFDPGFADQLLKWWKMGDGVPEVIQSSERITGKPSLGFEKWLEINREAFLKA
jgi:hypothetical protein